MVSDVAQAEAGFPVCLWSGMEGPRRVSPKRGAGGRPADGGGGGAWRRKFSGPGFCEGTRVETEIPHKERFGVV